MTNFTNYSIQLTVGKKIHQKLELYLELFVLYLHSLHNYWIQVVQALLNQVIGKIWTKKMKTLLTKIHELTLELSNIAEFLNEIQPVANLQDDKDSNKLTSLAVVCVNILSTSLGGNSSKQSASHGQIGNRQIEENNSWHKSVIFTNIFRDKKSLIDFCNVFYYINCEPK